MSRTASILCTLLFSFSLPWIATPRVQGQVDPDVGRQLTRRLASDEEELQRIRDRYKELIAQGRAGGTYDSYLVETNLEDCGGMFELARTQIQSFDFKYADQHLSAAEAILGPTNRILDEDASTPKADLKRDSVLADYPARNGDPLSLPGPALRAAIASEIQFAERVIRHADVGDAAPAENRREMGDPTTPCIKAKDQFILWLTPAAMRFKYLGLVLGSPRGQYLPGAEQELRMLHYSTAHELAKTALDGAQRVLSVCEGPTP